MASKINYVYETVQTILNKNSRGILSPERFNLLCRLAQNGVYADIINQYRNSLNKKRTGRQGVEYQDLEKSLSHYLKTDTLTVVDGEISVPNDFSFAPKEYLFLNGTEVADIPTDQYSYFIKGIVEPSATYPQSKRFGDKIKIFPSATESVDIVYYRTQIIPKWTYTVVGDNALFDPSKSDYQDLDIPDQVLSNVITKILEQSGVHIRDAVAIQTAEQTQQAEYTKDSAL